MFVDTLNFFYVKTLQSFFCIYATPNLIHTPGSKNFIDLYLYTDCGSYNYVSVHRKMYFCSFLSISQEFNDLCESNICRWLPRAAYALCLRKSLYNTYFFLLKFSLLKIVLLSTLYMYCIYILYI